jgi:hypothetical protein
LAQCFFLLLALGLTSGRFVSAFRKRSVLAFYVAAFLAMCLLALGPSPRFQGLMVWDKAPYWWLMSLPGVASLRQPSRFAMLAALCLALAAVLALERLLAEGGRRRRLVITAVACLIVWDTWMLPLPLLAAPARVVRLEADDLAAAAVLELPMGLFEDVAAMYRSTQHRRPLVNGYSGYEPPHYEILRGALATHQVGVLDALRIEQPLVVLVNPKADPAGQWGRRLAALEGARFLGEDGGRGLYLLPRLEPPAASLPGERVPVQSVSASRGASDAGKLIDGDPRSFWSSGHRQKPGDRVVLELGGPRRIAGIVLALGAGVFNYPRHLVVEVSPDGDHWRTVWQGGTAAQALAASLPPKRPLSISIPTGGATGRLLRLTQTERDPHPWSMSEITVLGAPN